MYYYYDYCALLKSSSKHPAAPQRGSPRYVQVNVWFNNTFSRRKTRRVNWAERRRLKAAVMNKMETEKINRFSYWLILLTIIYRYLQCSQQQLWGSNYGTDTRSNSWCNLLNLALLSFRVRVKRVKRGKCKVVGGEKQRTQKWMTSLTEQWILRWICVGPRPWDLH